MGALAQRDARVGDDRLRDPGRRDDRARPFFPRSLRPFPPPAGLRPEDLEADDPEATGYYGRFTWERIAARYEETVAAPVAMAATVAAAAARAGRRPPSA